MSPSCSCGLEFDGDAHAAKGEFSLRLRHVHSLHRVAGIVRDDTELPDECKDVNMFHNGVVQPPDKREVLESATIVVATGFGPIEVLVMPTVAKVAEEVDGERQLVDDLERAFHADAPERLVDGFVDDAQAPVRRDPRRVQNLQRLPVAERASADVAGIRHPLASDAVPQPPAFRDVDVIVVAQEIVGFRVGVAAHSRRSPIPRHRRLRPDRGFEDAEFLKVGLCCRILGGIRSGVPDVAAADVGGFDVGECVEREELVLCRYHFRSFVGDHVFGEERTRGRRRKGGKNEGYVFCFHGTTEFF